jgi:hypothetical protein
MLNEWALSLIQRFGSPIAVAVELSRGPIVYALQKFDCFVIFPINPSTLAKYREAFTPSGAKDDPTDAEFAVDLLLRHPARFKPLQLQSVEIRTLAILVEQRRNLVNDKIRITNRMRSVLKHYYPQVLGWFDHIDTPLFCDFIRAVANANAGQTCPEKHLRILFPSTQHALCTGVGRPAGSHQSRNTVNG